MTQAQIETTPCYMHKLRMDSQGYVNGCYYGVGAPLWEAEWEAPTIRMDGTLSGDVWHSHVVRASNRDEAKAEVRQHAYYTTKRNLKFFR